MDHVRPTPAQRNALLARSGITLAVGSAAGSLGRAEDARVTPARLVEGERLTSFSVGRATPCPHPLAFLDGVQRHEIVGYAGAAPLVLGEVAAGVRLRQAPGGSFHTVVSERVRLAVAREEVLEQAANALAGYERHPIEGEEPLHPARDLDQARAVLDRRRGTLEVSLGERFRAQRDTAWLIVDGSLAESPLWAQDPRMLGVTKSHATLPFAGADLERYLRLPEGHRTSLFQPASRAVAPVYSWGLRLWNWEDRDLFHGLVRVEAPPTPDTLRDVDLLSRWILAERSPVSAPDPRWDRLLYGVSSVERYLGAVSGER